MIIIRKPAAPAAITVDAALSDTSENPVQNRVITAALAALQQPPAVEEADIAALFQAPTTPPEGELP